MVDTSMSLDKWREYFRSSNSDIFHLIEQAIMVASSDYPYDFKLKRDRIAELLFMSKVTKCFSCDRIELAVPNADGVGEKGGNCKILHDGGGSKDTKESKTNSSRGDDGHREAMKMNVNHVSNYSYWDAEALTDEIEEQDLIFEEVSRIKEILDNNEDESAEVLFDSLRRLQLMHLSLEILKVTDIGKSVKVLRNHGSMEIQNLVKELIEDWRIMVDAWLNTTSAVAGAGVEMESVKTSVEEEEGLPSPPLDEGAFFTTPTSMELSQFFDGIDDDGNPQNSGEFNKNRENGKKLAHENPVIPKQKLENHDDSSSPPTYRRVEQKKNQQAMLKKQDPPCKPNRPQNGESRLAKPKLYGNESRPARPKPPIIESGAMRPKPAIQPRANDKVKVQQKPDGGTIQKKPMPPQPKLDCNNETSVRNKLEVAKRKLQERYQEAENAKKQRTVQVLEFHDLPKKILSQRNHQHMRPANYSKTRVNGRM